MDIDRLVIAKPSGNITALIFDEIEADELPAVSTWVQNEFPSVEQVLFVQNTIHGVHGQMAGGEFCGNAARSLGYVLSNGREARQTFTMSGISRPVAVETSLGRSKLGIQTDIKRENLFLKGEAVPVVHMEGISHVVLFTGCSSFYPLKEQAAKFGGEIVVQEVLDVLGLTLLPACGLLFVEADDDLISLTPYIFVRDTGKLCRETACASGSMAAAYMLEKDLDIHQPSNESLHVSIKRDGHTVKAEVDGVISILWDGAVDDIGEPNLLRQTTRCVSI